MTHDEILDTERSALRAWPAIEIVALGEWSVRFAGGYTDRSNTAQPIGHPETDLDNAIDQVENLYSTRKLTPGFKLSDEICFPGIQAALDARKYCSMPKNLVMSCPIAAAENAVEATKIMTDGWLQLYIAGSGRDPALEPAMRELARGFLPVRNFVKLEGKACGLGVVEGHRLWLFDIATHPSHRRQGHGRQVVADLLQWGASVGATVANLQVEERNQPAVKLYEGLGFQASYSYLYRKKMT